MWELSCSAAPNLPPACIAGSPWAERSRTHSRGTGANHGGTGKPQSPRKVFRNLNRRLPLAPPSTPPETLRPHPVKICRQFPSRIVSRIPASLSHRQCTQLGGEGPFQGLILVRSWLLYGCKYESLYSVIGLPRDKWRSSRRLVGLQSGFSLRSLGASGRRA